MIPPYDCCAICWLKAIKIYSIFETFVKLYHSRFEIAITNLFLKSNPDAISSWRYYVVSHFFASKATPSLKLMHSLLLQKR